jgi:hypothetical protein
MLGAKEHNWNDDLGAVTATIETPNLDALTINGSGDAELIDLKSTALVIAINGSSQIKAAGSADSLTMSIAGSGEINAQHLVSDSVTASIEGSGAMQVNARKSLSASVSGSGSVHYYGHPEITKSIAGSGEVESTN